MSAKKKTESPEYRKAEKKVLGYLRRLALADVRKGKITHRRQSKSIPDICEALLPDGTIDERNAIRSTVQTVLTRSVRANIVERDRDKYRRWGMPETVYRYVGPEFAAAKSAAKKAHRENVQRLRASARHLGLGAIKIETEFGNPFKIREIVVREKALLRAGARRVRK